MKRSTTPLVSVLALAAGVGVTATARDAHAVGPVDVEIGARAGLGTSPADAGPNPLGFGLGVRGGVALRGFYGGLNFMYYLGGTEAPLSGVERKASSILLGIEAGYGFTVGVLTIRPQLGIGNIATSTTSTLSLPLGINQATSGSDSNLYLQPALVGLISLGGWFIGADAGALLIPGVETYDALGRSQGTTTQTALTLNGQVGFKF